MITSKVIRHHGYHITRADYGDVKPVLSTDNVLFPKKGSLQEQAFKKLLEGTATHRSFDEISHTYRLAAYIDALRAKGWSIVNHDEACVINAPIKRIAIYSRYALYADFSQELKQRVNAFIKSFDVLIEGSV